MRSLEVFPAPPADLMQALAPVLATWPGEVRLAVVRRGTDEAWALNDAPTPAASLVKVPLAIAAYRAAAAGVLDLDERVMVMPLPEDDEAEFDNLGLAPEGQLFSWRKVVDRMITESDNAATNALIDRLGMAAIAGLCAERGYATTVLRRRMLDADARAAGRENLTTAAETASLLADLADGALLDAADTAELMGLLGQQRSREKLAAGLLGEGRVRFAHKTGELEGHRHDAGIVLGARPWAVAALGVGPEEGCDAVLADVMHVLAHWHANVDTRVDAAEAWLAASSAPDPRTVHEALAIGFEAGQPVLVGVTTEAPRLSPPAALHLGVRVRLLAAGEPAVVSAPTLQLRRGPGHAHELVSQLRLGDPVEVLTTEDDWGLLRGPDGYVAWGRRLNFIEHPEWLPDAVVATRDAVAETEDGELVRLSAGSRLQGAPGDAFVLPDGRHVKLVDGRVRGLGAPGDVDAMLALARRFRGLPYLWGGTTGWGIDCSGLVQLVHFVMGVELPRDADQQQDALPAIVDPADLRPGDPVFFPGHVGLWLGDGEFLHAFARPGHVTVNSFDPASPRYDEGLRAAFTGGGRTPLRA